MTLLLLPPVISSSAKLFCLFVLLGRAALLGTESTGSAEILRTDLSPLFSNLPEQPVRVFVDPFSLRVSTFTAMPKPRSKPPDLHPRSCSMVLYHLVSSRIPSASHPPSSFGPDLSFPSTIFLRFGYSKLHVLLLAGKRTTGSWIPVYANLLISVRRCKTLGLTHELSVASSPSKLFLPIKRYIMVTLSSFVRCSSLSFLRKKNITFSMIFSMRSKLYSAPKPRTVSSLMERVLLSSALMALAVVLRAFYDHVVVGLKKASFKSACVQRSASQSLVDWILFVAFLVLGGVLVFASGNEFRYWMLCSGNSASLSILEVESTLCCISESFMLLALFSFSFVVLSVFLDSAPCCWISSSCVRCNRS